MCPPDSLQQGFGEEMLHPGDSAMTKKHGHVSHTHTHTDVYSETPVTAPGRGAHVSHPIIRQRGKTPEKKTNPTSPFTPQPPLGTLRKAPTYPGDGILPKTRQPRMSPLPWGPLGPPWGSILGCECLGKQRDKDAAPQDAGKEGAGNDGAGAVANFPS